MNDPEILAYLQSHAPLERFYLFTPKGGDEVLMKYFDSAGRSWNLMEDDDEMVAQAVSFLKRSGVKVFEDFAALLRFEKEVANQPV
jgi:hypothetical protein